MSHHRNPKALLTPAMHKVLDAMSRVGQVPLHALQPTQARALYAAAADGLEPPKRPLNRVEDLHFIARDGKEIEIRLFAPDHEKLPVLVYFHGGGFVIGSVDTHDGLCRQISHLAHCADISVNYL